MSDEPELSSFPTGSLTEFCYYCSLSVSPGFITTLQTADLFHVLSYLHILSHSNQFIPFRYLPSVPNEFPTYRITNLILQDTVDIISRSSQFHTEVTVILYTSFRKERHVSQLGDSTALSQGVSTYNVMYSENKGLH